MQATSTTVIWAVVNLLAIAAIIFLIVNGFCAVHKFFKMQESILERLNEISKTNKKIIDMLSGRG